MSIQNSNKFIHEELLLLVKIERRITTKILDLLQKIEVDRSYLEWGYANLFDYLVRGLGYSESLAYQRKAALKICQEVPEVREKIDQGRLSLTTLARANKVLNTKNISEKRSLLVDLENKSSRDVDQILAREWPSGQGRSNFKSPGPAKRYVNENTIRLTLDLSEEEFKKLERLKALKSHKIQNLKELILMLSEKELEKYNHTSKQPSKSENPRQIKTSLRNYLFQSANYKCQYPGCEQTHFLQIDHIKPVYLGGGNNPQNLQVLCQSHNLLKERRQ